MSTHNIGFYGDLTKIIFELSSNTHLICFAVIIKMMSRCEADQHLCFRYTDIYFLNPKFQASSHLL